MVQYADGAVKAQLGIPDMKLPILYAFTYPERYKTDFKRLDLNRIFSYSIISLSFWLIAWSCPGRTKIMSPALTE
jgi:1-deoxy-D-xylulose 5-phosphate reductoisomerase